MAPIFGKRTPGPDARLEGLLDVAEVPVFPRLTLRILERLRDRDVDFVELATCLQWDPSLVARVLRTVNSAAFGTSVPVVNVRHAVSFLGRSQLEQLVIALAVQETLPRESAPGFVPRRFWQAASFRAALSRRLADRLHPSQQAESFTGGLLQDMAVPILAHAQGEDYGRVLETWHHDPSTSLESLEEGLFGWDHAEVGAALGRHWGLPTALVASIEDHHRDAGPDLLPAIRLVSLLRETRAEHGVEALVETAREAYGLAPDWTLESLESCAQEALDLARELT